MSARDWKISSRVLSCRSNEYRTISLWWDELFVYDNYVLEIMISTIIIVFMTKKNETASQLNDTVRLFQTEMKYYEQSKRVEEMQRKYLAVRNPWVQLQKDRLFQCLKYRTKSFFKLEAVKCKVKLNKYS